MYIFSKGLEFLHSEIFVQIYIFFVSYDRGNISGQKAEIVRNYVEISKYIGS